MKKPKKDTLINTEFGRNAPAAKPPGFLKEQQLEVAHISGAIGLTGGGNYILNLQFNDFNNGGFKQLHYSFSFHRILSIALYSSLKF